MPIVVNAQSTNTTTAGDLIDEVVSSLHNYTRRVEPLTTLTTALSATATSFGFDPSIPVTRGYVEVGDELLYVQAVDEASGTATVPPWGRAQQQSKAAEHLAGSRLAISPTWPRSRVLSTVNETIARLDTDLFAVRSVEFVASPTVSTYVIANEQTASGSDTGAGQLKHVIGVYQATIGPSKTWRRLSRYSVQAVQNPASFGMSTLLPGVTTITIDSPLEAGRTVRVVYAASLGPLADSGDLLFQTTGLSESARDLLVIGATSRLLMSSDLGRTIPTTVEQLARTDVPVESASRVALRLEQLFQARWREERNRLTRLYPTHLTWGAN